MPITKLNPYLTFNGNAAEAIQTYERSLGAKVLSKMQYGEAPGAKPESTHKDLIMHADVRIGEGLIMLSDATPDRPAPVGGNVEICLEFDDPAELQERFDALAEGGTVRMAVHDAFWGAKFGALTDKFGIQWMFDCSTKKR